MAKSKHVERNRRRSLSDPLAAVLQPPANESPADKERRLTAEHEAKQISDNIDEMLRLEKNEKKKARASEVKILLLGQSESGKSTTLKQFQLMHTPAAFHAERIAWRTVIYLNLVRSIRRILEAICPETDNLEEHEDADSSETASIIISASGRPASALSGTAVPNYEMYRRHLEPLVELEELLTRLLSCPDEDEPTHLPPVGWQSHTHGKTEAKMSSKGRPAPTIYIPQTMKSYSTPVSPTTASSSSQGTSHSPISNGKKKEMSVHTTTNWKKAFSLGGKDKSPKSAHTGEIEGWWEDPDDPVHALNACASAMLQLWRDPNVKVRLVEKNIRLEETSGFYLDEIPRVTAKKYIPTDEDVLKARIKTMGVIEHTFSLPEGRERGPDWKIYDVGGARNQRQAWAPYFEDVTAILFLVPVSAFDQVLAEDTRVNRLEDSLLLWKSLVSNKLLAMVNIVLFLNKCDLLQAKLDAGVRLKQHMISYGDRPNDYASVSKYFRNKFGSIHQTFTTNPNRELFIHLTAVTDTRRTAIIIASVRDLIIKTNLKNLKLF